MGLPEKHYFTIDDLAERWGRNNAYVEYLLETRKPNGERVLNAVYKEIKDPPGEAHCLTPSGKDQVMRLLDHDFPPGELAPLGEIIIMQEEVERFELEHGLIKNKRQSSIQQSSSNLKHTIKKKDKENARKIVNKYIEECKNEGEVPRIFKAIKLMNGKLSGEYKGKHTIRDWIKDLFPKESRRQGQGRPKKQ